MKRIYISNCPVCQSMDIDKVFTVTDYLVSKELFDIMECKSCSLRFTSPIPNEKDILSFYKSEDYISHTDDGNSIINRIYRIVRYFTLRSKLKKVEWFSQKKTGTLLDIGCGSGKFLQTMQKSGWNVDGVEVNSYARSIAEKGIGKTIYTQNDFFNSDQKFDVITMWHSLEHMHELKQYVQKISTSLNANGVIMIAVPNYKSHDAEYYEENWAAYDVPRHLYHFSMDAITKLFDDIGFSLIESRQLPFDPFYISLLSEIKIRGGKNFIKALLIGWRSYWKGQRDTNLGSSIVFILGPTDNK